MPAPGSGGGFCPFVAAHDGGVQAVDFSPDGRRLVSAGRDGAARSDAQPSDAPGASLPGALYAVRRGALDRLGAAGAGYRIEEVEVLFAGERRRALTWRAEDSAVAAGLVPLDWYVALIRAGASMLGLPAAHRRWAYISPWGSLPPPRSATWWKT